MALTMKRLWSAAQYIPLCCQFLVVQFMYSLTSLFTVWHVNEQAEIYPERQRIAGDIETVWELLGSMDCPQAGKIKQESLMQKEKKTDLEVLAVNFGNLAPDLSEHSCLQYIM